MSHTPTSIIEACHESSGLEIRADLTAAHAHVWEKLAAPGTWWNGAERLAIAKIVSAAIADGNPVPPWESSAATGHLPSSDVLSSCL